MVGVRLAITALVMAASGCATDLHPQWNGRRGEPYALAVGIIRPAEFRDFRFDFRYGHYRVGEASDTLLRRVFAQIFERTVLFDSREQFEKDRSRLAGGIELAIEYFTDDVDRRKSYAAIRYRFTLYSPQGVPLVSWRESGAGLSANRQTIGPAVADPDEAADLALEHAASALASNFAKAPEIRRWLIASGVPEAAIDQPSPDR